MPDLSPARPGADEQVSERDSYLIGTRPIDHSACVLGVSGVWYPNFGAGVEIFGWAHNHIGYVAELRSELTNG